MYTGKSHLHYISCISRNQFFTHIARPKDILAASFIFCGVWLPHRINIGIVFHRTTCSVDDSHARLVVRFGNFC